MINNVNGRKCLTLLYSKDINRFVDGLGNVIHDIYRIITPTQHMLFRNSDEGMIIVKDRTGQYKVTLIDLYKE